MEDSRIDGTITDVNIDGEADDAHGSEQQCVTEGALFCIGEHFSVPETHLGESKLTFLSLSLSAGLKLKRLARIEEEDLLFYFSWNEEELPSLVLFR